MTHTERFLSILLCLSGTMILGLIIATVTAIVAEGNRPAAQYNMMLYETLNFFAYR
eukprot:SAG22_NODE_1661_length_3868_cov_5.701512_4_plen_56_part_00